MAQYRSHLDLSEEPDLQIWMFDTEKPVVKFITIDPDAAHMFESFPPNGVVLREDLNLTDDSKPFFRMKYDKRYLEGIERDGLFMIRYRDISHVTVRSAVEPPIYTYPEAIVAQSTFDVVSRYLSQRNANRLRNPTSRKFYVPPTWYCDGYVDPMRISEDDFEDEGVRYDGFRVMEAWNERDKVLVRPSYRIHISY